MRFLIFITLGITIAAIANGRPHLNPFTTDSCTLFLDGTPAHPSLWRHCCIVHDVDYWIGGDEAVRLQSNAALGVCVNRSLGRPAENAFGQLLESATNVGGDRRLPDPWRWGYGWRMEDVVTSEVLAGEAAQITEKLEWARAWTETMDFKREYDLTTTQHEFILDALRMKSQNPAVTAF